MRFWRFLASSCERAYLSYATEQGFAKNSKGRKMCRKSCFDQTNSFFRLFVFCSFAPSPHEYTVSRGVPNPKNGENSMRLWFSRRVQKNPVYLTYTIFRVPPKKQNIANCRRFVYKKNFGRAHVCSPRRLPEIISKCYYCGNAACW